MEKIPLRLNESDQDQQPRLQAERELAREKTPVAGYCAVGFGLVSIVFGPAILFTPLGLLFSIVALLSGQAMWGFAGLLLAVGGVLTSPIIMGLIGFGAAYAFFDWDSILKPIYDMMGGGLDI